MDRPTPRMTPALRRLVLGTAGIVTFLLIWELLPKLGVVNPQFVPYATDTLAQLAHDLTGPDLWKDIALTLTSWAIGLVIATLLAVTLGTVIGMVRFLRRATHTTIEFLRPIPSVALIPLAILVYGFQLKAALVIVVYASFWQVFVQVLYGVADVDSVARDTAMSYGLSRGQRFRKLVFPTALPYIMTGVRLAAAVALILAVTAQMTIGNPGLGQSIIIAQQGSNWVEVYALIVTTGILGLVINAGFKAIERRSLKWHESVRSEEAL